ncbi:MAG: rhomboid family intramembrane serine protease [Litoreibacter sp.]|nr:rhomboid family intramembrane serine protease [Litoreibacter sp.]
MFPIRDHNPSEQTPYVTYGLIILNIAVFLSYWPLFNDPRALAGFFDSWAMVPAEVGQGSDPHTLVTSMFLHGGIMHLAGNMLFLWIFGDNLEEQLGHVRYLGFYLLCGIGAALGQLLSSPGSDIPTVGASGAIAGIMGGYLLLFPKAKVDILVIILIFVRVFALPAWVMLGVWFGLQLLSGLGADPNTGGVAYWAHAAGFLCGAVLVIPLWLRLGGTRFWSRTQGHPPHPEARYSASSIPRVRRRK